MIIKHKIFEQYNDYVFGIPYSDSDKVLVERNAKIRKGTDLISKSTYASKYSFYVPTQIGCEQNKAQRFVTCMDGEFVEKGSVLAERVVAGGLNVKKLLSPCEGVIDLSRIGSGYLNVLGEEESEILESSFRGEVKDVNPVDGLVIEAPSSALDIKAISDMFDTNNNVNGKKIFGQFVTVGNGKDLLLKADGVDYHNKIVFVGKYLHAKLLHDLFEKGAEFILTYSMDYEDFRRQGLPVGVFGGFGEIYCSDKISSLVASMNESFAIVDYDESQLFFLNDIAKKNSNVGCFLNTVSGALVKSLSLANYSMLGTVLGIEDDPTFISVKWENGTIGIINIGNVEFVSV